MRIFSTRSRQGRHAGLCMSPTPSATARRARVRSPKTNRLGPPPGDRCLTPALDRLDGYIVAGLPIVTALPGWVYGNGAWFRERVIEPIMAGRRVLQFGTTRDRGCRPFTSPTAPARWCILHSAGTAGGRYFLVNNEPVRLHEFAEVFARLANRPAASLAAAGAGRSTHRRSGPGRLHREPTPCSRTFDYAGPASTSAIPRSSRGSSKFSEHSMSNELCRLATTSELGESFDEVVLPHLDAGLSTGALADAERARRGRRRAGRVATRLSVLPDIHGRRRPRLVSPHRSQYLLRLARPPLRRAQRSVR